MLFAAVSTLLFASSVQGATLARTFRKGDLLVYDVTSNLQMERRAGDLETFIPEDLDLKYSFTMQVLELKADGIALIRYKRPTVTVIEGETFDSAPKTKVEKVNFDMLLTVSPINEILEMKDQAPKKTGKWHALSQDGQEGASNPIGTFIQELYRLALFAGDFESALDLSPRLPFSEVAVGETWQRTVGYQPQKLRGTQDAVVQRLDYTFTYKGPVQVNGKAFRRVQADLKLDTDLAEWAKQFGPGPDEEQGPQLGKLPLKLAATIEFDLDPKTGHTVTARATSQGGFKVFLANSPAKPEFEENLKGRTTLKLRSIGPAAAGKAAAPAKQLPKK